MKLAQGASWLILPRSEQICWNGLFQMPVPLAEPSGCPTPTYVNVNVFQCFLVWILMSLGSSFHPRGQIIFQNGDQLLKMKSTLFWLKYKNPEHFHQLGSYDIQSCQWVSFQQAFFLITIYKNYLKAIYKSYLKQRVLCRYDTSNARGIYVPYCSKRTQEWWKEVPTWGLSSSGGEELWWYFIGKQLLLSFNICKY